MTNQMRIFLAATFSIVAFATPASAAVTVGTPTSENCFPFGCLARIAGVGALYQQGYASSAFAGLTAINTLQFQGVRSPGGQGILDSASYALSLYYTASPAAALSIDPATNRGALLSNFGTFSIGGPVPDLLTLTGNAFIYNPSLGNLLLQITVTGLTQGSPDQSATFRYAAFGNADTGRLVVSPGAATGATLAYGAVTTFGNLALAVPEPATWAMIIIGFGLVGAAMRYRRRTATVAYG